jgi:hypothetical protein
VVDVHGLSFMGPAQSASVAPFTGLGRSVQIIDHMFEKPPPGFAVLVKKRSVTVTGFQDGATGYVFTLLNKLQTLPLGALQEPPIRLRSAMLSPLRTGQTETPMGNTLPFTVTVLPGTAIVALEAHKA